VDKFILRNAALLIGASVVVALAFYGFSSWLLQEIANASAGYWGGSGLSYSIPPSEIAFFDGVLLILLGALFLLGSGGISRNTSSAAMRAAVANALGKKTVGASEMMRRDAWRPKGHIRLGLTFVAAGIFSIILSLILI